VYGDSAYGAGSVLETLEHAGAEVMVKGNCSGLGCTEQDSARMQGTL
jgi:hypothetical protein